MHDSTMTDSLYTLLPIEIWIQIFEYLDFYDLQSVRLCSKKWFAITKFQQFDSKGVFKIIASHLDINHPAAEVIFKKRIENLCMKSVQFGDVDKLFQHIGTSLKALTLQILPIANALRLSSEYFLHLHTLKICGMNLPILADDMEHIPFSNLTQLKVVLLMSNEPSVNKYVLSSLLDITALEELGIDFCQKEEPELLQVLDKHTNSLKRLDLRFYEGTQLQVFHWMNVLAKTNLTKLSLRGNFCSQILVSATKSKTSLRYLNLTGSIAVDDEYITLLAQHLISLETLCIGYCGLVTDYGAGLLAKLPKLKAVDFTFCCKISSKGVCALFGQSVNWTLQELNLHELGMREGDIYYISRCLPNLRVLNLTGCTCTLSNTVMQEIFKRQLKLRELILNNCNRLSDSGIIGVETGASIQDLQCLEHLSFRGCNHVTDATLICGLKLPRLRYLDISHCDGMTNHGVETLVKHCTTLEHICITYRKHMNCEAIRTLTGNLGRLRTLVVNNCKGVSLTEATNWNQSKSSPSEVIFKKYPPC